MKHGMLAVLITSLALLPFIRNGHRLQPDYAPSDGDRRYDIDEFFADLEL